MNNLLVNRQYNVLGNWYAPQHFLDENFKSVVKSDYWHDSSSSGDWDGYFVQKIGNISYLIRFSQENNYPRWGFTLYTGNVLAFVKGDMTDEFIYALLEEDDLELMYMADSITE
jgi:hypothetical protein